MREGSAKKNSYVKSRNGRTNINMEGQRSNVGDEGETSESFVFPIVLYGAETWTMRKHERRKIDAFELWCWRRVLRVSWMERERQTYKKLWFYIALYPVHWTAQSALHFPPLADMFIPTPFSASLGSILAMQQLRNDYSLTFPPLSIARYSFIQLSRLRRREVKENAQTSKRYQRGFEPGLSRLRVRHSTPEPPRSIYRSSRTSNRNGHWSQE